MHEKYGEMSDVQIENKSNFSFTVFPNSFNGFINISYSLDTEMSLAIEVVDLFGKQK